MRIAVVVLGDLGQSPRMLFHARALAGEGADVDLVGTAASTLPAFIANERRIAIHTIADQSQRFDSGGKRQYLFRAALRGTRLLTGLAGLLCRRLPRPDVILVQNPPGVPTLAVAWLAARRRSSRFVVDWHNLTSAMLAMRLGVRHPLVKAVGRYEALFGRGADANLFVSSMMRETLGRDAGVHGTVFRDRPADTFVPLRADVRAAVRGRAIARLGLSAPDVALLISPTSWTADERLDLLFDALTKYDMRARHDRELPFIAMLITGKGPMKEAFDACVAASPLERVRIQTGWLPADEYAQTVAASDLGVCCHVSASGIDLPMKILDLFGAGVPVCAYDYGPCLRELISPGGNGVLFTTADECCEHLESVLRGLTTSTPTLDRLRAGAIQSARPTWSQGWIDEARPVLIPEPIVQRV